MVDYGTVHSCSGHPRPHAPGSPMEKERGTNLRKSSASLVYNKISAVLDINDTSIISISNIRESSYIFINHIKKYHQKISSYIFINHIMFIYVHISSS